jgi:uncharacterized protein DUF4124
MLRSLTLTTLIVASLSGVAHADVYRWVDEKGEAHYTDRWVPGSELIKSSKPRPTVESQPSAATTPRGTAAAVNANQAAANAKQQAAAAAAVKQDVAKTKEAQCKTAKERYQQAIDARRIYRAPAQGDTDRVYMSDAEADAYRLQARSDVTLACGSPPPPVQPQ